MHSAQRLGAFSFLWQEKVPPAFKAKNSKACTALDSVFLKLIHKKLKSIQKSLLKTEGGNEMQNVGYFFDSDGEQQSAFLDQDGKLIVWCIINNNTGEENFFNRIDQASEFITYLVKGYRLCHRKGRNPLKGLEQQGWQVFEARLVQQANAEAVQICFPCVDPGEIPADADSYFSVLLEDKRSSIKNYTLQAIYEYDPKEEQ